MPIDEEIMGYIKTFFLAWLIWFLVFLIVLGMTHWAFWGAISFGFIFAIPTYLILCYATGVKN